MPRPAVFLDRDDTLIVNHALTQSTPHPGDLFDPALVRLTPGAAAACRDLKDRGFALVVVTNQSAVARGVCTIAQVEATNARMCELVRAESGVEIDAVYFSPYHASGTVSPWNTDHPSRKPAPGMLLAAANDLSLDMPQSWMIGDAQRDIQAALAAGISLHHTILIGDAPAARFGSRVADMAGAAAVILHNLGLASL